MSLRKAHKRASKGLTRDLVNAARAKGSGAPASVLVKPSIIDAITLEVLRHALEATAEQMNSALMRAAYSTNITDRRDSSCAVFLANGESVAQSASGTPLHLGVMPAVIRSLMRTVSPASMKAGDQYLLNRPYPEGPGHLNDLTLVRPVLSDDSVVAFVANQAHHVDVGGIAPGSMSADSTEIFQEGLQLPPVALVREGKMQEDIFAIFLTNVRTPETSRGDLLAQVAANNVGVARLEELFVRWGDQLVIEAVQQLVSQAERQTRTAIAAIPDGSYTAEDSIDGPDGALAICVRVDIVGDSITADFNGTATQVLAPLNCRPATVHACLAYVITAMLQPGTAPMGGALRPLRVVVPDGSLLNAAYPASLVHSNVVTSQRICDVLIRALHRALPERTIAACCGSQSFLCIGGWHPTKGEPFTYVETHGGGAGAGPGYDGESVVQTHMTNTLNSPIEVLEQEFPFVFSRYEVAENSAGLGCWRGGFGLAKSMRVACEATVTIAADRTTRPPWALAGGSAGACGTLELEHAGERRRLPSKGTFRIHAGDVLHLVTPGGGGWGDRRSRAFDAVASDLASELVIDRLANGNEE